MTEGGIQRHVRTLGREPGPGVDSFVLLHGYGGNSSTWVEWAPRLAERGHVVLVDFKGLGAVPAADGRTRPIRTMADWVVDLLDQLDLRRVTLVGHSMGGGVALLTAIELLDDGVDRLDRLVLVSSAAYKQRLPPFIRLARLRGLAVKLIQWIGPERVVRGVLRRIVHHRGCVTDRMVHAYADAYHDMAHLRALVEIALHLVPPDLDRWTRRYAEITVPTLVLWGRTDRVVPLRNGERLVHDMPNARLAVLEACGHIPPQEEPDASYAPLTDFLEATR